MGLIMQNMGAGLHGVHRGAAMAFGVALSSLLLEKRLAVHHVLLAQQHDRFAFPVQQTLEAFQSLLLKGGEVGQLAPAKALMALGNLLAAHVWMPAYMDCFLPWSLVFPAALLPAWLIRVRAPRGRKTAPSADPQPVMVEAAHTSVGAAASS